MDNQVVTIEYLLSHGFRPCKPSDEDLPCQFPFDENEGSLNFLEIKHHRQMFGVVFCGYNGDPNDGWHKSVYVQEDAGCGFIEIPFPWWDLHIEYFESVYYGIRGHKPILSPQSFTDAEYEIIGPKQLNQ